MKILRTFLAFSLVFAAAGYVYALENDKPYNAALFARVMSSTDQNRCSGVAEGTPHDECKVTRNYLADISKGKDKGHGYPPQAFTKYCVTRSEKDALAARMP